MCPSIDWKCRAPFVETIRVEHGQVFNLSYHNTRMNRTRKDVWGVEDWIDLASFIRPESYQERTKCRVEYADRILKVEYVPYRMRSVCSLRVVSLDDIDYFYKSCDRHCLAEAFALRETCDDVLIVRRGLITDTSICNVALWNGQNWVTPKSPLLEGTMRAFLLDKKMIVEADIRVEEIASYSRIRMFNALIDFGEQELDVSQLIF